MAGAADLLGDVRTFTVAQLPPANTPGLRQGTQASLTLPPQHSLLP
jgi:hypothetical protein